MRSASTRVRWSHLAANWTGGVAGSRKAGVIQ
jgi:hypothetical protein